MKVEAYQKSCGSRFCRVLGNKTLDVKNILGNDLMREPIAKKVISIGSLRRRVLFLLNLKKKNNNMSAKRTDEALWERIKKRVINADTAGTASGKWSARKAQMAVRLYKEAGGGYSGAKTENSLVKWSKQDWTTKSGKPSSMTGERYLPKKAIENLTDKEYKKTTAKKRSDTKKGIQFSKQPKEVAKKTKKYVG